ncbi:MAG: ferritin [Oligoflexales bacterium]
MIRIILILALSIASSSFARIPDQLASKLSEQIKNELEGAYIYLAISQNMYEQSLEGAGYWYAQQFYEELNHARIMMDFVEQQQGKVEFFNIPMDLNARQFTLLESFEYSLQLEETQTERIRDLYVAAKEENAYETEMLMHFFLKEQVEEEDVFGTYLDRLQIVRDDAAGTLAIDVELGARPVAVIYVPGGPMP